MAPEQARDATQASPASDVFSLGATLVYAATGHAPYEGETVMDILVRLATEPPDLTGLPGELADLIAPCLERVPRDRPTDATILDRLGPFAAPARPRPLLPSRRRDGGDRRLPERRRSSPPAADDDGGRGVRRQRDGRLGCRRGGRRRHVGVAHPPAGLSVAQRPRRAARGVDQASARGGAVRPTRSQARDPRRACSCRCGRGWSRRRSCSAAGIGIGVELHRLGGRRGPWCASSATATRASTGSSSRAADQPTRPGGLPAAVHASPAGHHAGAVRQPALR